MADFSIDMPIEEILIRMNNNKGNTEAMNAGPCFLQYKLHKELLKDQQGFQEKQLRKMTHLAVATWFLAAATIALVYFTQIH